MDIHPQLELEALAAVGEMCLFDKTRGNTARPAKHRSCDAKRHILTRQGARSGKHLRQCI
jgi:hypothetical protein